MATSNRKLRKLKKRAQEMHGHYNVHSARIRRIDNDPFGEYTLKQLRGSFRSRVGVSRKQPWRNHV